MSGPPSKQRRRRSHPTAGGDLQIKSVDGGSRMRQQERKLQKKRNRLIKRQFRSAENPATSEHRYTRDSARSSAKKSARAIGATWKRNKMSLGQYCSKDRWSTLSS